MLFKKGMSLIVTIVNSGFSQKVVEASQKAGAEGATILSGRGNGKNETTSVLGVQIQPEKELVMILVRKSYRKDIMKQIVRACDLASEGMGMTFCLPVDEVAGVRHMFENKVFRRDDEVVNKEGKVVKAEEKCEAEAKEAKPMKSGEVLKQEQKPAKKVEKPKQPKTAKKMEEPVKKKILAEDVRRGKAEIKKQKQEREKNVKARLLKQHEKETKPAKAPQKKTTKN